MAGLYFSQRESVLIAQSRQLAARSEALFGSDLELASLLAVQAYRTSPTVEARTSLYSAAGARLMGSFDTDADGVGSVAFNPDGAILATGTDRGDVHLWDTATGQRLNTLLHGYGWITDVEFAPNGATLAAGSADGTVRLWDTTTGEPLHAVTGHENAVHAVEFGPDGATLATSGADGTVRLWDTTTGEERRTLTGDREEVFDVAFSPDGTTLAAGSADGTVRLWDTTTGEERRTFDVGTGYPVHDVLFGPDGDALVTNTAAALSLWEAETGTEVLTRAAGGVWIDSVAVAPDGTTLVYGVSDGRLRLWDSASDHEPYTLTDDHGRVTDLAFQPDGTGLATGSFESDTAQLLTTATSEEEHQIFDLDEESEYWSRQVAFGSDGTSLTTVTPDGAVHVWDVVNGDKRRTVAGHEDRRFPFLSPDGATLVTTDTDGEFTVHLWDAVTGEKRHTLTGRGTETFEPAFSTAGESFDVNFSPDGHTLAIVHEYGSVWLWNATTGKERHTSALGEERVLDSALSTDGTTLATIDKNGAAHLWNVAIGRKLRTLKAQGDDLRAPAFSPNGTILATSTPGGTVHLWDTATGVRRHTLAAEEGMEHPMAFSPNGTILATSTPGGTVHLWDTATGEKRRTLIGHGDTLTQLAFSPDGSLLAAMNEESAVRVWGAHVPGPEEAMTQICAALGRDFTAEERARYLPAPTDGPACPFSPTG
nr:WD40 repeat domain-containing protein [Nocardiopsis lucentensis]